jgi:glyoxylase-like metal-dependent hydrolase (beta-lactamase superfamily II)
MEVIALCDGHLDLAPESLRFDRAAAQALLAASPAGFPPRIDVNCFALRRAGRCALVDTGAAESMGPKLGALAGRLAAAGIDPAEVDTVLLTHIHPDHSNGLADAAGAACFPNAELVVHAADLAFWCDPDRISEGPEPLRQRRAMAIRQTGAYADRLRPFATEAEVFPGVTALPLPGHTPGHSGFLLACGDETVAIWGDTVHLAAVQVPHPEATVAFDIDPEAAVASRRRMFDLVASAGMGVLGMHLPFPGLARLERSGAGYRLA